jgi:peptidase M28-like protein
VASRPRPLDAALLDVLTSPREAGTPAAAAAREVVAGRLRAMGYRVEVHPFRFHPSALRALPLLGAGLGWMGLVLLPLLVSPRVSAWAALAAWLVGVAALAALVFGVGSGASPLAQGGGVREDANLLAARSAAVRCWIVAHLDTKAQGHSMAGRLVAVWLVIVAVFGLSGLALARLAGPLSVAAAAGAALAVAAGALAGRGRLVGQSPGVRDNGSGVAAALAAAAATDNPAVGIVITGAEEFGLMGARALVRERAELFAGRTVVNLDTIDETGALRVVSHDGPGRLAAQTYAARLGGLDLPVTVSRLPIGILVDSLPFARAGATAVTIARLDWSTLRRLHTARDSAEGCSFETAVRVGEAVVALIDVSDFDR